MLLAVPNLSEGRDEARIEFVRAAFDRDGGVLDVHSDRVHNRSVFTLRGEAGELASTLLAGAVAAAEAIDMREYDGAHPAVGSIDVCPVVWLSEADRDAAFAEARNVASMIATELEVPVFLYGKLASAEPRRERAFFRDGGLEALVGRMQSGGLEPDLGPRAPNPSAGATLVTARPPLAAFNLVLEGADIDEARQIAAELRESGGGLPGVRAIGIDLGDGRVQVSTNVHDTISIPLVEVVAAVDRLARHRGAWVVATELIGLVPEAAMAGFPEALLPDGFDPARHMIERRL